MIGISVRQQSVRRLVVVVVAAVKNMDASDAKKALAEAGITVKADECVKVVVRCRPLNDKERKEGRKKIVDVDTKNLSLIHI